MTNVEPITDEMLVLFLHCRKPQIVQRIIFVSALDMSTLFLLLCFQNRD